jgi:hypothetical protein
MYHMNMLKVYACNEKGRATNNCGASGEKN